jgi:hypothetical protein
MCAVIPRGPLDLLPLPEHTKVHGNVAELVTSLQKVHETVRHHLESANQRYKAAVDKRKHNCEFQEGDLVWVILTKERFATSTYNKLSAQKIGPLPIIKKINSNVYQVKLPDDVRTSDVFNVRNLIPYYEVMQEESPIQGRISPTKGE